MRCPECKCNTFKPVYAEAVRSILDDHPFTHDKYKPPLKELQRMYCTNCHAYDLVFAGETAKQAYARIIHETANE